MRSNLYKTQWVRADKYANYTGSTRITQPKNGNRNVMLTQVGRHTYVPKSNTIKR